jgi:hypothetical protein
LCELYRKKDLIFDEFLVNSTAHPFGHNDRFRRLPPGSHKAIVKNIPAGNCRKRGPRVREPQTAPEAISYVSGTNNGHLEVEL